MERTQTYCLMILENCFPADISLGAPYKSNFSIWSLDSRIPVPRIYPNMDTEFRFHKHQLQIPPSSGKIPVSNYKMKAMEIFLRGHSGKVLQNCCGHK